MVDENSNKLVLAVSVYIQNPWFHSCAKVFERLGNDIIYPLMEALGIDDKGDTNRFKTIREFYNERLTDLKEKRDSLFESC